MISAAACQLTAGRCRDSDRLARWLWVALAFLCRLAAYSKTHQGSWRVTGWLTRKNIKLLDRCRDDLVTLATLPPDAIDQALAITGQLPAPNGPGTIVRDEYGRLVDLIDDVGRPLGDIDKYDCRVGFSAEERATRLQVADQLAAGGPRLSGCVARWWWATLIILARRVTQLEFSRERLAKFLTGILTAAATALRRLAAAPDPHLRLFASGRWLADIHCPDRPEAMIRACPPRAPCVAGGRTGKAAPMTG